MEPKTEAVPAPFRIRKGRAARQRLKAIRARIRRWRRTSGTRKSR